jgi:hypothetical protein
MALELRRQGVQGVVEIRFRLASQLNHVFAALVAV